MITLTDAAVDAACLALNDGVRSSLYRDRWESLVRHALEAALPHLTDDGATNTPPAVPSGVGAPQAPGATGEAAERASGAGNTVAAPSSPHLKRLDRSISIGRALGQVIADLEANDETLLDWWPCDDCPNHPGPCACSGSAMARTELANAILPLFGEGATPAIDREALRCLADRYTTEVADAVTEADSAVTQALLEYAEAVLALGGAS